MTAPAKLRTLALTLSDSGKHQELQNTGGSVIIAVPRRESVVSQFLSPNYVYNPMRKIRARKGKDIQLMAGIIAVTK
jgi:hypothetical protein